MAGPWSYKPQTGVRFPQLRPDVDPIPRSVAVSRPLKPVTLVRFQLGEPQLARERDMVAVVYWSARLAVNEEVWVQSPPVTPTGCGPVAGRLPWEQAHAGSIPASQTSRVLTNGRQPVPKTGVVVMSPRGSIPPPSSFSLARSATSSWPVRLPARLPPFQGGEAGAAPARATHVAFV